MGLLKSSDILPAVGAGKNATDDPKFSKSYPYLWSHLTQDVWDNGDERPTSGLLIFLQEGILKAMLRDKAHGLCLWVAATSFTGLLEALEAGVQDPGADWRIDRQKEGDKARRVRRGS